MECPGPSFRLAPSRRVLLALCALHLAVLAGLAGTAIDPDVRLALVAWLLASLAWRLGAHVAARRAGGTLLCLCDGQWWLDCAGRAHPVTLRADSTVLPFVIVLRVQHAGRVLSLVVAGDSLPRDQLRRLRVLLRLKRSQPGVRMVSSASGARSG